MPAPTSYAGPRANEGERKKTYSQSTQSNMSIDASTVGHILDRKGSDIFSVKPDDSMRDAVDLLNEKRIGALIVTNENGALEGILSERDIVRKLSEIPGQVLAQNVEALMTRKVHVSSREESLMSVLRRMTEGRFRHMPVMDGDKIIGIVTIGDVVNHRLNELEHEAIQLKQMIVG